MSVRAQVIPSVRPKASSPGIALAAKMSLDPLIEKRARRVRSTKCFEQCARHIVINIIPGLPKHHAERLPCIVKRDAVNDRRFLETAGTHAVEARDGFDRSVSDGQSNINGPERVRTLMMGSRQDWA